MRLSFGTRTRRYDRRVRSFHAFGALLDPERQTTRFGLSN